MADVAYLVRDLLFTSKIRETATQLGLASVGARDLRALLEAARGARLVVLDLRLPEAMEALDLLAQDEQVRAVPRVGFVDHERAEVFSQARDRGCGRVLAKGKFSGELAAILTEACGLPAPR